MNKQEVVRAVCSSDSSSNRFPFLTLSVCAREELSCLNNKGYLQLESGEILLLSVSSFVIITHADAKQPDALSLSICCLSVTQRSLIMAAFALRRTVRL